MTQKRVLPYGAWPSPLTASMAAGGARFVQELEAEAGAVWLIEQRPDEQGRATIMRLRPDGAAESILAPPLSARSRVHEYGGGAMLAHLGAVYFVNDKDQRIWRDRAGAKPEPLSAEGPTRFADMTMDARRGRIIAVCEDHGQDGPPQNYLAAIDINTGAVTRLWQGSDFVAHPRLSPDGARLAFIAWNHPHMPWDATGLHVAHLQSDGGLSALDTIAAEDENASVIQPQWGEDGALYYLSDAPGAWGLHVFSGGTSRFISSGGGEIGGPLWQLRPRSYAVLGKRAFAAVTRMGQDQLVRIDLVSGETEIVAAPFTAIARVHPDGRSVIILAGAPGEGAAVWRVDGGTGAITLVYRPEGPALPEGFASIPHPVSFANPDGALAHGFYYPPAHAECRGPENSAPPLIVTAHGGPTGVSKPGFTLWRHYWTSRGFAILDVNYRGSSGYGRAYRMALNGHWGTADIEDVASAARHAAAAGLADPQRMAVYGGSAGGFIVLAALAFHHGVFAAGVNLYGVADLEALAADTHKFEARYTDSLIGPLPDAQPLYRARSPLHAPDGIRTPLLTLQGLDDKVVPPAQSEAIFAAVKASGAPCAYVPFAGEGHGFRKAENNVRALETAHAFLARIFALTPPDNLPPLKIENL